MSKLWCPTHSMGCWIQVSPSLITYMTLPLFNFHFLLYSWLNPNERQLCSGARGRVIWEKVTSSTVLTDCGNQSVRWCVALLMHDSTAATAVFPAFCVWFQFISLQNVNYIIALLFYNVGGNSLQVTWVT